MYAIPPGFSFFTTYKRAFNLVSNPIESMDESLRRFGDTYTVFSGITRRIILTRDPELIEYVLKKNQRNYNKSKIVSEKLGRFLGNGLLTSNGAYWLRQRRLIQPGFHIQKVHDLYAIMKKTTDAFLDKFPEGNDIDVLPLMNDFAFTIVIKTLFDLDIPEASVSELGSFITDIQEFVVRDVRKPHKSWWHKLSGEVARNLKRSERARDILRSIVQERQRSTGKFSDLLDMLLSSRYEDTGEAMSEDQIIDEILILIIAGHETTANALSWSLYLLAQHPEELRKLRDTGKSSDLDAVVKDPHFNAVINETMRLYPPAWVSDRVALEDDAFKNYSWPKGTIMMLLYYAVHRDERFWTNAGQFEPSRFLNAPQQHDKPKAFYPFGAGPRMCIGNNFAIAEMAIFLHHFVREFDIKTTGAAPRMKPQVTLRPDGVLLDVKRVRTTS